LHDRSLQTSAPDPGFLQDGPRQGALLSHGATIYGPREFVNRNHCHEIHETPERISIRNPNVNMELRKSGKVFNPQSTIHPIIQRRFTQIFYDSL
jgi:hypothetical protein